MTSNGVKPNDYFAEIGAWPRSSGHILGAYVLGFALSLALTFGAYFLAVRHALSLPQLTAALIALALAQFAVQAACFLHLSRERSSRARLAAFGGALVVVGILISGSLWIMYNLNERMTMPSSVQMEQYMNDQGGGF